MKIETYKCDGQGCGKLKGSANHWFMVYEEPKGIAFPGRLIVAPFPHVLMPPDNAQTYCGRECVQKRVEQFLQETMQCQPAAQESKISPSIPGGSRSDSA